MIRYFILMIMLFAILLTSCAMLTQQPTELAKSATKQVDIGTVTTVQQEARVKQLPETSGASTADATAHNVQVAQNVPLTNAATALATEPATAPATAPVAQATISIDDSMDRVERRKMKQLRYAAGIDSLVQSHCFRFLPNSMQELPGGFTQLIYNELYFFGVFKDHVEVHMPTVRGNVIQYIEILNFDTFEVKNYQTSRTQFGWSVSFNMILGSDTNFAVSLMVYNQTGEAVLNLLTLSNTVRYVGYIQPLSKN